MAAVVFLTLLCIQFATTTTVTAELDKWSNTNDYRKTLIDSNEPFSRNSRWSDRSRFSAPLLSTIPEDEELSEDEMAIEKPTDSNSNMFNKRRNQAGAGTGLAGSLKKSWKSWKTRSRTPRPKPHWKPPTIVANVYDTATDSNANSGSDSSTDSGSGVSSAWGFTKSDSSGSGSDLGSVSGTDSNDDATVCPPGTIVTRENRRTAPWNINRRRRAVKCYDPKASYVF